MILDPVVAESKLSGAQRAEIAARNTNIGTGITVVPKIADKAPEVVIDKESESEGEKNSLEHELNVYDIEI